MSFQITEPGFYRQRNGGKAEVFAERDGVWFGASYGTALSWSGCGKTKPFDQFTDPVPADLVEPWQDPPAFSIGDLVLVNKPNAPEHQHYGTIKELHPPVLATVETSVSSSTWNFDYLTRVTLPAPLPEGYRLKPRNVATVVKVDITWSRTSMAWLPVADWFHDAETSDRLYTRGAPHFFASPIPQPVKAEPDVEAGEGWRRLKVGELCVEGDERLDRNGHWVACFFNVGATVKSDWEPHRRRVPQPFRISDKGPGVYETRDGGSEDVTWRSDKTGLWGVGENRHQWYDSGHCFKDQREWPHDLVKYLRPLPETPEVWTPTCELRWKQPANGWAGATPAGAQMLNTLEQRWTCGSREEWRAVQVTQ